jgi:hypothetical protein
MTICKAPSFPRKREPSVFRSNEPLGPRLRGDDEASGAPPSRDYVKVDNFRENGGDDRPLVATSGLIADGRRSTTLSDSPRRVRCGAAQELFLPGFTRGVFGVARSLLILFKRCIRVRLGTAFSILARPFLDDTEGLPSVLSRALRLSLFGADPVGVLSLRSADLARCCRFHLCSLPLRGLCAGGWYRGTYPFQLSVLSLCGRLQAFHETWFLTGHVFNLSFRLAVTK